MKPVRYLLFTDLDGTLLDHHSYQWQAAEPALRALERAGVPVIFTTSKTAAELAPLQQAIGNQHPCIAENGALVVIPPHYFHSAEQQVHYLGEPRQTLLAILARLRDKGFQFQMFSDLSVQALSELTGLDSTSAGLALQRQATEPLLWQMGEAQLEHFRHELAAEGLTLLAGGRFLHVMGHFDKGEAMAWLVNAYRQYWGPGTLKTIALGDGPNDAGMLMAADYPVLIPGARSAECVIDHSRLRHAPAPGPKGWNQSVLALMRELSIVPA
ncbi:MAG: HAD-IIB family hydrolase [Marinobacter sp.]|nr:HAD-IIB family hydrolase [Marinobacter sp.]